MPSVNYITSSQFATIGSGVGNAITADTQTIQMAKEVYGKITFPRVVDTEFTEFVSAPTSSF